MCNTSSLRVLYTELSSRGKLLQHIYVSQTFCIVEILQTLSTNLLFSPQISQHSSSNFLCGFYYFRWITEIMQCLSYVTGLFNLEQCPQVFSMLHYSVIFLIWYKCVGVSLRKVKNVTSTWVDLTKTESKFELTSPKSSV